MKSFFISKLFIPHSQAGQWLSSNGSLVDTLTGNTGGAVGPDSSANINIVGTGTISVAGNNSTNTLTISSSGGGGFVTWSVVTGSTQAMAKGSGYIVNYSGVCTLTLPATAGSTAGDIVVVTGINTANGWKIAQNANQFITFSTITTTTGTGGYLQSSAITDSVMLIYVATNNWQVISSVGNITYN